MLWMIMTLLSYRITKYNPQNRNNEGNYLKNEWTSFSDIGKSYEGIPLTLEEYIKVEHAYIQAVLLMMQCVHIDQLQVQDLEKHARTLSSLSSASEIHAFKNIKEGINLYTQEISDTIRLILREYLWCRLAAPKMYVHFGYDYYMYIGTAALCANAINTIHDMGLFVEPYISPYQKANNLTDN